LGNGQEGYLGCFYNTECSNHHFFQLNHQQQGDLLMYAYDYYHKPGGSHLGILGDAILTIAEIQGKIPNGVGFVVGVGKDLVEDKIEKDNYNAFRSMLELYTQTEDGNAPLLITITQNIHRVQGDCRAEWCAPVSKVTVTIEGTSVSYIQSVKQTTALINLLHSFVAGEMP
jgi:hypothetical protein